MAHNILRTSTRTTQSAACLLRKAPYSNRATSWFRRFLSPSEEKELYLGITSSFREKLVEQSNKSTQTYSHIIEHAFLGIQPTKVNKSGLSIARIEQLKMDLDTAGKQKDVQKLRQLEAEMENADLKTVTIYNRLIRSYVWSNSVDLAHQVLTGFNQRGLVSTTRSYTYLVQAYLKTDQLDQAKCLVEEMKQLSLLKLRNDFDYSIILKYYKVSGDTHAIDFLWRDVSLHIDTIKPSNQLFISYLEHLLSSKQEIKPISQLAQQYLTHSPQSQLQLHQYITWMKAVTILANNKQDTYKAERLLLHLIKKAPPKTSWDKAKSSISTVVASYLDQDQELKALAFYYRLGKMGVPEQAFEPHTVKSIEAVVNKVEKDGDEKAIIAELEGLVISHI